MERVCLVSLATILLVSLTSISCGNGATAPAAPTGLTCQWVSSSQIDLSWDASSRADGYNVYRCTGASCTPTTQIHAESTTSWSDTGLASSTTYCYRLTAYNEVGESGYGAIVSCTTYNPQVAWNKTFGGSLHDSGHSVQQTPDGGYIIAASTYFPGGESDFWLIKTDSAGNEEWNKTFGGADTDFCYSGQLTSDGGYIMTGYTDSYGAGNSDVWLIKTDSSGNVAWNRTFGGPGIEQGYSVQQSSDGGYVVVGFTNTGTLSYDDFWLIKTDSSGNLAFNKTFGYSYWVEHAISGQQTSDGGYIIAGDVHLSMIIDWDIWLVKTDSSGNVQWDKMLSSPLYDRVCSVEQTSDGGYIFAGDFAEKVWLMKTDSSGNVAWNRTFDDSIQGSYGSVQQTSDGGYIFVGDTLSGSCERALLLKTDSSGNIEWDMTFASAYNDGTYKSVQQTSDGGYIIAGYAGFPSDVWLVKVTV